MRVRPELRGAGAICSGTARVLEPAMPTALSFARPASLALSVALALSAPAQAVEVNPCPSIKQR